MSLYALKLNNARVDWLIVGGSGRYGIPPNIKCLFIDSIGIINIDQTK